MKSAFRFTPSPISTGPKFRETQKRFDFLNRFRDVVVSGEVKMLKPDPEIFEHFLDRNGLRSTECLFIDDNRDNVAGRGRSAWVRSSSNPRSNCVRALVQRGLLA